MWITSCGARGASFARAHGQRPVDQLGRATIDRWREQIGHLEDSTRNLYQSHVRTFCRWLVMRGAIRRDPTVGMPRVPLHRHHPVTLTPDVVDKKSQICC